jgi:hypothetical protein
VQIKAMNLLKRLSLNWRLIVAVLLPIVLIPLLFADTDSKHEEGTPDDSKVGIISHLLSFHEV